MSTARLLVLLAGLALIMPVTASFSIQQTKGANAPKTPMLKEQEKEEILTNDSVIQLLKVGINEDVIISKIQKTKHSFDLSVNGMVALKQAEVSDRLMHFMMDPAKPPETKAGSSTDIAANALAPPAAPKESPKTVEAIATAPAEPSLPKEMGVYARKEGEWAEISPEIVNWQTGGWLKSVASAGIVKGDLNGKINGAHSPNAVRAPLEFLIVAAEGVAITEFQLIKLRGKSDSREFRTVTGGVFHASGGATRDLVQFEGSKIASRTFSVKLSNLGAGEYGFLPPSVQAGSGGGSAANLGKMYSFRVGE
jgi:hypothetical protein